MLKSSYQPFFCKKPIPSGIYVSIIKFLLLYLVVTSTLSWKSFIFLFLRCTMSYIKIRCIISIIKLIIIMLFDRSIICFLTGGCSSVGLRGLWLIGWAMVVWRGGGWGGGRRVNFIAISVKYTYLLIQSSLSSMLAILLEVLFFKTFLHEKTFWQTWLFIWNKKNSKFSWLKSDVKL